MLNLKDIHIRDPFILVDQNTKTYYLYSNSFINNKLCFIFYKSSDLVSWSEPKIIFEQNDNFWGTKDFWAPEVHFYNGKYYMFATFSGEKEKRNCAILVSDSPEGPFKVHTDFICPREWFSLDATLYIKDNEPYIIFSHEWVQIRDGEICYVKMSKDLKKPIEIPHILFKASDASWVKNPEWNKENYPVYITDGPFVYKINNQEFMVWSSFDSETSNAYAIGVVYPKKDMLCGEYKHEELKLPHHDSGHSMIFTDLDGKVRICFHEDNCVSGAERAAIYYLGMKEGKVFIYE